jgi:hypothetical protein
METAVKELINSLLKECKNKKIDLKINDDYYLNKEKQQFVDFLEWIEIADIKFQFNNKKIVEQYYNEPITKIK